MSDRFAQLRLRGGGTLADTRALLIGAAVDALREDGFAAASARDWQPGALAAWIANHGQDLGRSYANELDRHYR